jgi:hypothetical protein
MPEFINGPKDGARVPDLLLILDVIDLVITSYEGKEMVYSYHRNIETRNWEYHGETPREING